MLKIASGDRTLSHIKISQWFNCFKDGQTSKKDDACSDHPFTAHNLHSITHYQANDTICGERRIITGEIAEETSLSSPRNCDARIECPSDSTRGASTTALCV
jgi:hypothetical protein